MPRRSYSPEIKASAIARVLAGETLAAVARDVGTSKVSVHNWVLEAARTLPRPTVNEASSQLINAPTLHQDMSLMLHEIMETVTSHARHYRSEVWLSGEPGNLLESTRTLGSRLVAVMDRLGGAPAERRDDSDPS